MMPRDPEENNNVDNISEEDKDEHPQEVTPIRITDLEKALSDQKCKTDEYLDALRRTQADFANYRRRTEQEKADLGKYANATLFCDILPVLDDLELALSHTPEKYSKTDWVEGVRLVERKFKAILEKQGVKPVCALGMAFDPRLHEAIKQDTGQENTVIAELQKGYTLGERLLRPSRVIVGSGEKNEPAADETAEE
jgi:molecular chaperone GrpE